MGRNCYNSNSFIVWFFFPTWIGFQQKLPNENIVSKLIQLIRNLFVGKGKQHTSNDGGRLGGVVRMPERENFAKQT